MRQDSFSGAGFEKFRKKTRKEQFLEEMEKIIPWKELTEAGRRRAQACPDRKRVANPFHPALFLVATRCVDVVRATFAGGVFSGAAMR